MCSIFRFETYKQATNLPLENICVFVEWLHMSLISKQKMSLSMR